MVRCDANVIVCPASDDAPSPFPTPPNKMLRTGRAAGINSRYGLLSGFDLYFWRES